MNTPPDSLLTPPPAARYLPAMKMHHRLPLLLLLAATSAAASGETSAAPSGIPAWDTAWSFDPAPDAPTYRSLEPGLVAFWTDFLGEPPAALAPVAPDFARALALGIDEPAEAAALLVRAFPDAPPPTDLDPPPPLRFTTDTSATDALSLPWAHAAACIRHAAGLTNSALAHWDAIAVHGDAPPAPVPDSARAWRDLYASAMAAHRYLLATADDPNRAPPAIRRRRAALLPLGARRAAEAVVLLDPRGPRGRVVLATLIPPRPTLAARPPGGLGLTPLAAAFADLGCSNAIASIFRARAEIAWAGCCRGNGLASEVTPEGWRGFRAHNAIGVDYALRARTLEPDWPHSWLALMTPAGTGAYPDETLPALARAALARQIDYAAILPPLFNYSLPRWRADGAAASLRALRALVDLPRPDTDLPYRAVEYLGHLVADQTRFDRTPYARAGCPAPLDLDIRLWSAFRDMFERYLAAPSPAVPLDDVLRTYLATAARFRDPAPALAALDRLPPDEAAALWTEPDDPAIPRGCTLAGAGGIPALRAGAAIDAAAPHARARHAAALAIGLRQGATDALAAIRAALPDPTPAAATLLARMDRDQTIALDWEPVPDWTALDRTTIPIATEGATWLRLPTGGVLAPGTIWKTGACIRHPYERVTAAAADFTLLAPPGSTPAAAPPGFYVRLNATPRYGAGVLFHPATGECRAFVTSPTNTRYRHTIAQTNLPPDTAPTHRLRARIAEGRLDAWLDNDPVFTSLPLPADFPPEPDYLPAFGTSAPPPGTPFTIDRIRVIEYTPPP